MAREPRGDSRQIDAVITADAVRVAGADGSFCVVEEVAFRLTRGRTLGIVGESGSGKTTVALGVLGYARPGVRITSGSVRLGETDLLSLSPVELRRRRGREISYVPQDPSTGLTPGMRIGAALHEMLEIHAPDEPDPSGRVGAALRDAQLPDDPAFRRRYPFQLSGGQQQRVAIALALICRPRVVVMDEPTTGLDVTTQARLLGVIRSLVQNTDTALVYVTHDLGVIRALADEVMVMYGGRVVEHGGVNELFSSPCHPYTRGLLEAVPRVAAVSYKPRALPGNAVEPWDRPAGCPFEPRCQYRTDVCATAMPPEEEVMAGYTVRCFNWTAARSPDTGAVPPEEMIVAEGSGVGASSGPLLELENLSAGYGRGGPWRRAAQSARAVNGISLTVGRGTCLAIVGESGSGKTTTLRCIAGLHQADGGAIRIDGTPVDSRARRRPADLRRRVQLVPQNPDSSLNPHRTVGEIVGRPLRQFFGVRGQEQTSRVTELLGRVDLRAGMSRRQPAELSGGEKQRVAIARALAAEPELLLCDEVCSALDVSVQAGILELLTELRTTLDVTLVFVTHDLAVVRSIATEVVVMQHGVICERGSVDAIFERPEHPYTRELLGAVADLHPTDYPAQVGA